ncbi:HAD family phosphatase [Pseudomonas purpurea]|uniref:HAD family hydrolase n=1 Tax=Pseudomonas purpurea TaxID=3136737 RepID=UPI003262DF63
MPTPAKKTALLLDMDGVLIDSREAIEWAWAEAAKQFGYTLDAQQIEDHIHGIPGPQTLLRLFSDLAPHHRQQLYQRVFELEKDAFSPLNVGMQELMTQSKAQAMPLGLVTSSWRERVEHVLNIHDLTSMFDVIITRSDVKHGKPAGDPYVQAKNALNVEHATAIEDSISGVKSAVAARCYTYGYAKTASLGQELISHGASQIIDTFETLTLHND